MATARPIPLSVPVVNAIFQPAGHSRRSSLRHSREQGTSVAGVAGVAGCQGQLAVGRQTEESGRFHDRVP